MADLELENKETPLETPREIDLTKEMPTPPPPTPEEIARAKKIALITPILTEAEEVMLNGCRWHIKEYGVDLPTLLKGKKKFSDENDVHIVAIAIKILDALG